MVLLAYLNEEEFGLPHQRGAAVPPEEAGQGLKLHTAVRPKKDPLIPMTQEHAHERG